MTSGSETNLRRAEHGLMLRSLLALVVLLTVGLVAPSTAGAAGERYALIVAGASGGDGVRPRNTPRGRAISRPCSSIA